MASFVLSVSLGVSRPGRRLSERLPRPVATGEGSVRYGFVGIGDFRWYRVCGVLGREATASYCIPTAVSPYKVIGARITRVQWRTNVRANIDHSYHVAKPHMLDKVLDGLLFGSEAKR